MLAINDFPLHVRSLLATTFLRVANDVLFLWALQVPSDFLVELADLVLCISLQSFEELRTRQRIEIPIVRARRGICSHVVGSAGSGVGGLRGCGGDGGSSGGSSGCA